MARSSVLLVDDGSAAVELARVLERHLSGLEVHSVQTSALTPTLPLTVGAPVVLLAIGRVRSAAVESLIGAWKRQGIAVLVLGSSGAMDAVLAALRAGAADYVLRDLSFDELIVPRLKMLLADRAPVELREARGVERASLLIGSSEPMQQLRQGLARVAAARLPALVLGETGTGKELVVREIHQQGARPEAPFIDLNCAAIPPNLMESQLFGHDKGAFTGADRRHDGYLSAVQDGTLFLDELGELPLELQARLLRVLETKTYRRLGSHTLLEFRGRIVAATCSDIRAKVQARQFREDLLYRLNTLTLRLPALRRRNGDIPELVAHFLARGARPLRFTAAALECLMAARWPGNVRQLKNYVDRVAVMSPDDVIDARAAQDFLDERDEWAEHGDEPLAAGNTLQALVGRILALDVSDKLAATEEALVAEAIRLASGNKTAAARLLGVHRKVIERRVGASGLLATLPVDECGH